MFLRICAGLCLFCFLCILVWAYWPLPLHEASLVLNLPVDMPDVLVTRQAILEFPTRVRLGESVKISLSLLPNGDETAGQDYSFLAEAALELFGFDVAPAITQQLSLIVNQPLRFRWQVVPQLTGGFEGIVPLHLQIYAKDGSLFDETLLSAQPCKIEVVSLFGMNILLTRLLGMFGCIGAIFLFLVAPYLRKV